MDADDRDGRNAMTRHQEQNAAIREQFSQQAPGYAKLVADAPKGSGGFLFDALQLGVDDQVLDVGCGTGRLTLSMAKLAGAVTGIDLTPEMLAQAKAVQIQQGATNVTWLQGDILPLPFNDASFSAVVTQATFHHLADPAAVLAQMARACKPGGRVAVVDLTPDPAKAKAFDEIERLRDPSHMRVLSTDELRGLRARLEGFEEIAFHKSSSRFPTEPILATSFPLPGDMERVRALYREDAASGRDRFGLSLAEQDGQIFAAYPMTTVVWRRN
jgi:ubiquinone/menaquinone biosynthesis C-methylase UbiE